MLVLNNQISYLTFAKVKRTHIVQRSNFKYILVCWLIFWKTTVKMLAQMFDKFQYGSHVNIKIVVHKSTIFITPKMHPTLILSAELRYSSLDKLKSCIGVRLLSSLNSQMMSLKTTSTTRTCGLVNFLQQYLQTGSLFF